MEKEEKKNDELLSWIHDITIALLIAFCISLVIKPTVVNGPSMEPSFHDGDYLITSRIFSVGSLKKGDVVTFRYSDGRLFIKRVIGLPGDKIEIYGGKVYVNGSEDDQSYTKDGETWVYDVDDDKRLEVTVPEDSVFCMGDNRNDSHDSREKDVGCIPEKKLKWKVMARIFSPYQIKNRLQRSGVISENG